MDQGLTGMSKDEKGESREMSSGRVVFDKRGNAVWEWRAEDGRFRRDASTTLVRKLVPRNLDIASTTLVRKVDPSPAASRDAPLPQKRDVHGFNPYDRNATGGGTPVARRPRAAFPPAKPTGAPKRSEGGLMERLARWRDGRTR